MRHERSAEIQEFVDYRCGRWCTVTESERKKLMAEKTGYYRPDITATQLQPHPPFSKTKSFTTSMCDLDARSH